MRISAKGRYALASMICMAQRYNSGEYITVISVSKKLGLSKIYLEQVFAQLKKGNLVHSEKGAQGGYQLAQPPQSITVYDVLYAVESALFEGSEDTVSTKAPEIEAAIHAAAFGALESAIKTALQGITISDLVSEAEKHRKDQGHMYFI